MKFLSYFSFKKVGLCAFLMLCSTLSTHAATKYTRQTSRHYLGGEIGGGYSPFHVGFRYLSSFRFGKAGGVIFDIQPTAGIGTGYYQVLRLEGGANFGIGSEINGVAFSFVMLGVHLELDLNIVPIGGSRNLMGFGIGPSFMLPLSTSVYWKRFMFGLHWGIDANTTFYRYEGISFGVYQTSLYARLVVAYRF